MQYQEPSPLRRALRALTLLLSALALPASAHAVHYVRSVEYVEVNLATGVPSASTNLTKGQNTAHCVPFASASVTGDDIRFGRRLTDVYFETSPSRVTVQRDVTTGIKTISVGVFVVEFDPAYVNVYQGTFANAQSAAQPTTSVIPAVTLAKAALVFYYRYSADDVSNNYDNVAVAGWFGLTTQLNWQRNDASLGGINGHYYVFEAKNAEFSVQPLSFGMAASATSATAPIPTAVDPDKTFVIASYRTAYNDDDNEDGQFRVFLSDATTLAASRTWGNVSGSNVISDIRAFVVQLGGNVRVQRGALSYGDTDTQKTATIQAVRTTASMVWNGVAFSPGAIEHGGVQSFDADQGFQRLKLANATTVQGDRGAGACDGTPLDCNGVGSFEVIDFDPPGRMRVKSGYYQGTGSAGKAVYVGFRPDAVFVKRVGGGTDVNAVLRTYSMSGDNTKSLENDGIALAPNLVQTLDSSGFTVGSDTKVNEGPGAPCAAGCDYYWVAFKAAAGELVVDSYNGDGAATKSISVGFQPEYVVVLPTGASDPAGTPVWASSTFPANESYDFDASLRTPNAIRAFEIDGFQVGQGNPVNPYKAPDLNINLATYHYLAWNAVPGRMAVGTYAGNGLDNQYKNQVGFYPEWVLVKKDDIDQVVGPGEKAVTHKPASTGVTSDTALRFAEIGPVSDTIQKLLPLGFEVGTDVRVNIAADATCRGGPPCTYHWVAFGPHVPQINYRSIGTTADLANQGTITVTAGSTSVTKVGGTGWKAGNRGRGDRLTVGGNDYQIALVSSNDQLTLASPAVASFSGPTYTIARQFPTLSAWEDCIDGLANGGSCPYFPPISDSLVSDDRSEVGIAYDDGASFAAGLVIDGRPDNQNTGPANTITLTADAGNRHYGLPGTAVVVDNGAINAPAIRIRDNYVTVEWMEIQNGSGASAWGIEVEDFFVDPGVGAAGASRFLLRNNLIHVPAFGIVLGDRDQVTDAYNNIIYGGSVSIRVLIATLETWSQIRLLNNTLYGYSISGVDSSVTTRPEQLILHNNIAAATSLLNDFALAAPPNAASSNNLSTGPAATGASPGGGARPNQDLDTQVQFVNRAAFNLHISATSTAVDSGANLASVVPWDVDGAVRQTPWDIGADDVAATTAVSLQSFGGTGLDSAVELRWQTASELRNLGFNLYRSPSSDGPWQRLTSSLIPGLGSSPTGASYSYHDAGLANGTTYFYLLEDVETTGRTERHGPVSATPQAGAGDDDASDDDPDHGSGGDGSHDGSDTSRITYGDPRSVSLRILERGPSHVVLELLTPGFYATPQEDGSVRIEVPGFEEHAGPGTLSVPVRRALVEALAGRKVRLASITPDDLVSFDSFRLSAAGSPEVEVSAEGMVSAGSSPRRLLESSRRAGFVPRLWARLAETLFQGETKKADLELAPLRHDPASGKTLLARRLTVRVEFFGTEPSERSLGGSRGRLVKPAPVRTSGVFAQLAVNAPGLYRVRYEDLFGSSRRGVNARSLRLSHIGQPVAYHIEPDKALFAPGSSLYFLSEGASLNPQGEVVYELALGQTALRMSVVSASPSGPTTTEYLKTLTLEQNHFYQAALLEAQDLWLWDLLVSPTTKPYPFTVEALSPSSTSSHLRVVLQGASDFEEVDHHLRVAVNGSPITETTWDGKTEKVVDVDITPGILVEGTNTLSLENVGDAGAAYSMVFLNRFEVSYPRLLSATNGFLEGRFESGRSEVSGLGSPTFVVDKTGAPVWLKSPEATPSSLAFRTEAGHRYLAVSEAALLSPEVRRTAPTSLRSTAQRATWLLLSPREFLPAAKPLVDLRRSQGLLAKTVALEDVFSEFGHGEASAKALQDFLSFAFHSWRTPPRYVVLLGDSTYDPKDYLQTGFEDRVPSPLVKTSFLRTASDPTLAAVNGQDSLPDFAIGRLSAGTLEGAERLVQKLVAFEQAGRSLNGTAVLVADNADIAGSFEADQDLAANVLQSREVSKLYLRDLGAGALRSEIRAAFDSGPALVSYVGHGATAVWASENVFNNQDIPSLEPQPQQPLLLTLNCLNGFFQFPSVDSLAEALVKAEGKGAIAAFSPSGLSVNDAAQLYHRVLLREIESAQHQRLGDAVLAAQKAYADQGAFPELLSIYHLFGDPALKIR